MLDNNNRVFNNLYGSKTVSLQSAKELGDFNNLQEILAKGPEFIINEVKESGLKGRGGAFFSTGIKLSFIRPDEKRTRYLVINADEGEPGTCKDRELIRHEPYKIIEGAIIASYTIGANSCYIYVRGEFYEEAQVLQDAINDCYKNGLLGNNIFNDYSLNIYIHMGAGSYICGEETALLESLEGKKGFPRSKPPFPADIGLYGLPTIIHNVETIATLPTILRRGAKWYSGLGVANSLGTKLFCISGHVHNPCVVEEALGVSLKEIIEKHAGGVIGGWNNLLAVIPGGSSTAIIPGNYCDKVNMDSDSLRAIGTSLGTGAIMVFNKTANILNMMRNVVGFYHEESCGQCTPCREGSGVAYKLIDGIIKGKAKTNDVDLLENLMNNTFGTTICALNDATVMATRGFLKHYKNDMQELIKAKSNG